MTELAFFALTVLLGVEICLLVYIYRRKRIDKQVELCRKNSFDCAESIRLNALKQQCFDDIARKSLSRGAKVEAMELVEVTRGDLRASQEEDIEEVELDPGSRFCHVELDSAEFETFSNDLEECGYAFARIPDSESARFLPNVQKRDAAPLPDPAYVPKILGVEFEEDVMIEECIQVSAPKRCRSRLGVEATAQLFDVQKHLQPLLNMESALKDRRKSEIAMSTIPENEDSSSLSGKTFKTSGFSWEVSVKDLKFVDRLGVGAFGEVWRAEWLGTYVAVKTIIQRLSTNQEFVDSFRAEIFLASQLHHPNVVMFMGACMARENMCMLIEYCENGSLHELLRNKSVNFSMRLVTRIALDIARGLHYLHSKENVIQRDIKSRNILMDYALNAKIGDFGLSKVHELAQVRKDQGMTQCGTPAWLAPELVRQDKCSEKVDIYSYGIVLWELLTREEPFKGEGAWKIIYAAAKEKKRPKIPTFCPESYKDLMTQCWLADPDGRPDASQIISMILKMKREHADMQGDVHFRLNEHRRYLEQLK